MYLKVKLSWNVIIAAESLDAQGLMLQKAILIQLIDDFATKKASKELGHLLAVTTLDRIGVGKVRQQSGDVMFPVDFTSLVFKVLKGEILEGTVTKILKNGIFLRCGPEETIYLASQKMPGYSYVPGENPMFVSEKSPKIEKDATVRFSVLATKWMEAEKEFRCLASIDGDFLGPV